MMKQKYGYCPKCKKQIILTLLRNGRGWLECDPYIHWFIEDVGDDAKEFYTADGTVTYGILSNSSGTGIIGYYPHKCS